MSIFNQILSAIDNPETEASTSKLSTILDRVKQLSGNYQANPSAIQSAMSIVGNYTNKTTLSHNLKVLSQFFLWVELFSDFL
ncbi:MAG: hypothetical protein QNJ32_26690 [Xenococcaceae cyanobacterium MO_167.B27]|nr:hypothetical protein [Xenococcaceae cyanobacterium MO_167.B27]